VYASILLVVFTLYCRPTFCICICTCILCCQLAK